MSVLDFWTCVGVGVGGGDEGGGDLVEMSSFVVAIARWGTGQTCHRSFHARLVRAAGVKNVPPAKFHNFSSVWLAPSPSHKGQVLSCDAVEASKVGQIERRWPNAMI